MVVYAKNHNDNDNINEMRHASHSAIVNICFYYSIFDCVVWLFSSTALKRSNIVIVGLRCIARTTEK